MKKEKHNKLQQGKDKISKVQSKGKEIILL